MKYRRLGRTGLQVSELGFGAWGIGKTAWIGADDTTSLKALKAARDAGINFFDTALAYGRGHSERLLQKAFGKSNEVVIASKVPPRNHQWPAWPGTPFVEAYSKSYVLDSLATSLANLGRETIDLYQFHVWTDEWARDEEWLDTVEAVRRSGMARFVGISINDHQPRNAIRALKTGQVDTVQVIYNLFDQSPQDKLLPYCRQWDIGVIARSPFDEGSLAGMVKPEVTFPEGDFRNSYFAGKRRIRVWQRVQRLASDAKIPFEQLPELALRFCLSHAAVSTVIPGMRSPAHVHANAAACSHGAIPDDLLRQLQKHRWARNFYSPPRKLGSRLSLNLRCTAKRLLPATIVRMLKPPFPI